MAKIHFIKQTIPTECGLCAVAMLASYYGFNQTISFYRKKFEIGRDGLTVGNLCLILQGIGFDTEVHKKLNNISDFELKNKPVITMFENHFVIISKIKIKSVVVYDPQVGRKIILREEFDKLFKGIVIEAVPNKSFVYNKVRINDFKHIVTAVKDTRKKLFLSVVISVLAYAVQLFVPLIVEQIMNTVVEEKHISPFEFVDEFIAILVLFFVFSHLRNICIAGFQSAFSEKLSVKVICHLFKIPYSYFDNRSAANVMFRLNLMTEIENAVAGNSIKIIVGISSVAVIFTYLCIDKPHILPLLLLVTVLAGGYTVAANKKVLEGTRHLAHYQEQLNNMHTEIVNNMFQIKCMGLDNYLFSSYKEKYSDFKKEFFTNQKRGSLFSLVIIMFTTFTPVALVIVISLTAFRQSMSVGELFALYTLLGMYITYVSSLFSAVAQMYLLKSSLFYLNDLIDEREVEPFAGTVVEENFDSIEISNLNFKYNDNQTNVLNNINFCVRSGQKVSVIGLSGSGKTTLIKLMSALYRPTSGDIKINGVSLKNISLQTYEKLFAVVPQQPIVFNKTIRENIVLNRQDVTDDEVIEALMFASISEEVKRMPMGIHTIISGSSGNLSGGQIQRICLARAFIKKPQIIILDEAMSSLDAENEKQIYKNLKHLNISCIVISHRLSTVIDSDKIFFLKDGSFAEVGTHDELIQKHGCYYNLFSN